jgi:hypothetical protein
MTREEVIQKAIQDYPIGTLVKGLYHNHIERITSQEPLFANANEIWFTAEKHNLRLYNGQQWAEIMELPGYEIY